MHGDNQAPSRVNKPDNDGTGPLVNDRGLRGLQLGRVEELQWWRRILQRYVSIAVKSDEMNPANLLFADPLASVIYDDALTRVRMRYEAAGAVIDGKQGAYSCSTVALR